MGNVISTDWDMAVARVEALLPFYRELGPVGLFGLTFLQELLLRYYRGERTDDLFESMMEAE